MKLTKLRNLIKLRIKAQELHDQGVIDFADWYLIYTAATELIYEERDRLINSV